MTDRSTNLLNISNIFIDIRF